MPDQIEAASGRDFPAEAEALRRAGRAADALEVAAAGVQRSPDRIEGRVALALSLLDLGDAAAARGELEEGLATWLGDLGPAVETEAVAEAFEGPLEGDEIDDAFVEAEAQPEEMVSANDIAERALEQAMGGDFAAGSDAEPHDDASHDAGDVGCDRVVTTLEKWLVNLRRRAV